MNDKSDTKRLAEAVANLATTIIEIIENRIRQLAETAGGGAAVSGGLSRPNPVEGWVSKREAAEHLKISVRTVDNWMKRGFIPYLRTRRRVRLKLSEIDEAMKRRLGVNARY